jgi:small subunit ribosomal protein S19e
VTAVKDVPADVLIAEVARYIKESVPQVRPPVWADCVKTGPNKTRPPADPDWWYVRAASVLRKLYLHGPAGVGRLRGAYSYRAKVGRYKTRPERTRKAGGAVIRKILQQLEQAGLVARGRRGRSLTPEGRSLLDAIAAKIARELARARPELLKYTAPPRGQ